MNLQNLFRSYCAPLFHPLAHAFVLNKRLRAFILCTPFWLFAIWTTWQVRNNFFFWDTVQLGAQHAHFFYENSFKTLILPNEMDSGHPPFFGFYIAMAWFFFDKTLTVSHLAMLPFLLGIVWQAFKLGEKTLGAWQAVFLPLVFICNPIMASQAVLVSPDVVLVFFFLMAFNNILIGNKIGISIAILGLSMISMRGMMVGAMLFIFNFWLLNLRHPNLKLDAGYGAKKPNIYDPYTKAFAVLKPYLLGGLCALSFLIFHYLKTGWIGYHGGSEWENAFQRVDFQGFIKNCTILIWRLLDFGHLIVWVIIAICYFILLRGSSYGKASLIFKNTLLLWRLFAFSILILTPTLLIYKGLLAHRYLLPIYLILNILCLKLISDLKSSKLQNALYVLLFVGLLSGNFWVYPQPISTGWDATLAHLPYYRLRNDMLRYLDNEGIKRSEVGTAFPNLRPAQLIDLEDINLQSANFSPVDFNKNHYIFYSNVMNDFNKKELDILEKEWKKVKILRGGQVVVILYGK